MIFLWSGSLWWSAAGCTMLHFLWLGAAIGVIAWVGRHFLRRAPISARYAFTIFSLFVLAAAPCVLFVNITNRMHDARTSVVTTPADALTADDLEALMAAGILPASGIEPPPASVPPPVDTPHGWSARLAGFVTRASSILPWIWITGTAILLIGLLTGVAELIRMKRRTRLLHESQPPAMVLRELARRLGVGNVDVALTDRRSSPSLFGILRPIILLPDSALSRWNDEQLRMVLLHELWHVRRRDHLVNFAQRLVESLLFFHPAVWLISAWARTDREYCCDSAVLGHMQKPFAYAEMLAALAGVNHDRVRLAVAMGEHNLVARIQRVLDRNPPQRKLFPAASAMVVLAAGTGVLAYTGLSRPDWIVVPDTASAEQQTMSEASEPANFTTIHDEDESPLHFESPAGNEARMSLEVDRADLGMAAGLADRNSSWSARVGQGAATSEGVTLRLVDERGLPVVGARLGIRARWDHNRSTFESEGADIRSDDEGIACIVSKSLLKPAAACDVSVPGFAYHEDRQLAGTLGLTLDRDWGRTLVLTMRPVARVQLTVGSDDLEASGQTMDWSKAFIRLPGNTISYLLRDTRDLPYTFVYLLPPGDYQLVAFGGTGRDRETDVIVHCFSVPEDQAKIDLGVIQLPALDAPVPFADHSRGSSRLQNPSEPLSWN